MYSKAAVHEQNPHRTKPDRIQPGESSWAQHPTLGGGVTDKELLGKEGSVFSQSVTLAT